MLSRIDAIKANTSAWKTVAKAPKLKTSPVLPQYLQLPVLCWEQPSVENVDTVCEGFI